LTPQEEEVKEYKMQQFIFLKEASDISLGTTKRMSGN
jgi:hypothetical protein